jgi:hypothetical protein
MSVDTRDRLRARRVVPALLCLAVLSIALFTGCSVPHAQRAGPYLGPTTSQQLCDKLPSSRLQAITGETWEYSEPLDLGEESQPDLPFASSFKEIGCIWESRDSGSDIEASLYVSAIVRPRTWEDGAEPLTSKAPSTGPWLPGLEPVRGVGDQGNWLPQRKVLVVYRATHMYSIALSSARLGSEPSRVKRASIAVAKLLVA